MTNEQVTDLLRDCQQFWKKWRDVPLPYHGEGEKWMPVLDEAVAICQKHGGTDHVYDIVKFFSEELHYRAQEREAAHGTI